MTQEREPFLSQNSTEFGISVKELYSLIDPKSFDKLDQIGGTEGLLQKLKTDPNGLSGEQIKCDLNENQTSVRQKHFGINKLMDVEQKGFWELVWEAYQDKTLILLSIASLVSLTIGIYEDSQKPKSDPEPRVGWVEGVAIILAVLAVVFTNSVNDYQKEKQFRKLNAKRNDRKVLLYRDGQECEISVFEVQVGDVFLLQCGDIVPVDGICLKSNKLVMDESAATGESDPIKKFPYDKNTYDEHNGEPFILSGSKVQEGTGSALCINVGENSYFGKTMMAMREESDNDTTPLQKKLEHLAENIAKLGMAAALLMLIVLLTKFWITTLLSDQDYDLTKIFEIVVRIIIQAVTIVVVAVPEGLPMAVTLALAYATTKMLKDNNLVRVLASCETMGNATVVCSDKTGTLTQNRMTVVEGVIAQKSIEGSSSLDEYKTKLEDNTKNILNENVASNSTAFEDENGTFVGSKTECALLEFTKKLDSNYREIREKSEKIKEYPFSSKVKSMTTVIKTGENRIRIHSKGASEMILTGCTQYINDKGEIQPINDEMKTIFEKMINRFASNALRTIGLAYKDIDAAEVETLDDSEPPLKDLVLLGIVGIEDPLREGVANSVEKFKKAGVYVKMITGDNIVTAKAIAKKAGIWTRGGVVISGSEFRGLSEEERMKMIPKMQVLARSSPSDKQIVVKCLQKLGETVAMTGDGTNDGPALKMADVGFSMGITGTEVAKEASAIILMDDNFNSIVVATKWGRAINDSVRKFLQFQLTVNIAAVVVAFVTASVNNNNESVLTTVQLLWINLIMDTLAALALATEPPNDSLLSRYPTPKDAPLITFKMWKHILGQAVFQIFVNIVFVYFGSSIMHTDNEKILKTCIFNVFVFLQVFNEFNCRRINDEINVFENINKNFFFIVVQILIILGQVLIVEFGGYAFGTVSLSYKYWLVTLFIGMLSLPVGLILRLIPTSKKDEQRQIKKPIISQERMMLESGIRDVSTSLKVFNALRRKPRKSTTASFSRSVNLGSD